MRSRIHPTYKTKYGVANWASYNRALVRRGDVTLWSSPEAIATWDPRALARVTGSRSTPTSPSKPHSRSVFSSICHSGQTEECLASVFGIMGLTLSVPDHTTLSRRGQSLALALRRVCTGKRLPLAVDSTGLSIVGEGEWAAAEHGGSGKRGWKKLHLGVDRSGKHHGPPLDRRDGG